MNEQNRVGFVEFLKGHFGVDDDFEVVDFPPGLGYVILARPMKGNPLSVWIPIDYQRVEMRKFRNNVGEIIEAGYSKAANVLCLREIQEKDKSA